MFKCGRVGDSRIRAHTHPHAHTCTHKNTHVRAREHTHTHTHTQVTALQNSEELSDGSVRILPPALLFAQYDDFDRLGPLPDVGQLDPEWLKEQNEWIAGGGGIRTHDKDKDA